MRKYILNILFLFTINSNAQTLVDTNKVWNVVSCLNFGPCGTTTFQFGGDTIIGNYYYKKLIINNVSWFLNIFPVPIAAREDLNTNKIYFHDGSNEYLGYDFSLSKGDTFTTNFTGCSRQMIVDSIDMITLLNGELRKRIRFSGSDTWIEGIGSLSGLTNSGYNYCTVDIYLDLNCFKENDTLKYQNTSFTDCFYNTLDVQELYSKNFVKVMPNPFSEFATIKFEKPLLENSTFKILNIDGKTIREYQNIKGKEFKIQRDKINSGIYIFQLFNKRRQIAVGKFIIE